MRMTNTGPFVRDRQRPARSSMDRVPDFESVGWWFESTRAGHISQRLMKKQSRDFTDEKHKRSISLPGPTNPLDKTLPISVSAVVRVYVDEHAESGR